ncbi:hypothetical protein DV517_51380 [Streptomyces sp. S816]|nr:hypothetical protein DV517_51380 [Streptomyces sp. S816]
MAVDPLIEPRNGDWKKAYQATRTGRFTRRPVNPRPSHPFAAHPLPGPADTSGTRPRHPESTHLTPRGRPPGDDGNGRTGPTPMPGTPAPDVSTTMVRSAPW